MHETELERLSQSSRRVITFWLLITVALLAYCLFGAFTNDPGMLYTWRGVALILLSTAYLAWYALWAVRHLLKRHVIIGAGTLPWRAALVRWGMVSAVLGLMTALSPMMGWMFWASFGMALSMFQLPLALLPAGISIIGVFYALIATTSPPPEAIIW